MDNIGSPAKVPLATMNVTLGPNGDIRLNVNGAWPPAMLFALAGQINRIANSIIDNAEMQNALALETLGKTGLRRTDR